MSVYDLKGIDLGQVGNNKYVNYTFEDFMADQQLSRSGAERVLGQNKIRLSDLQQVNKPNNILDRVRMYLEGEKANYQLPKYFKEYLAEVDKPSKKEKEIKDPLGNIEDFYKEQMKYEREMDPFNRGGRVLDSTLEFLNYNLTSPKILADLRRESDYVQNRLLQAAKYKQGLPDSVQDRLRTGALAAAQKDYALAAQLDAATRRAGVGMRPPTATFTA